MHTHPCATESKRKGDHALFAGVNTLPEASAVGNESFHLWDIECAFMDYSVHLYCLRASVCSRAEACIVSCNIARVIFGCEAVLQTLTLSLWDCFACFVLEKALFFILSQFYCRFVFFKKKTEKCSWQLLIHFTKAGMLSRLSNRLLKRKCNVPSRVKTRTMQICVLWGF